MPESPFDPFPIQEAESQPKTVNPRAWVCVFRNRFGHWRAGWRIPIYFVAVFVVGKAITTPLKLFAPNPSEAPFASWTHSLLWAVGTAALTLAGLGMLRWLDRRPVSLLGLGFGRRWLGELAVGLGAGVAMTACVVLVLVVSGSVSLELSPELRQSLGALPKYLVLFTLAAAVEEMVFRGYPLQALAEGSRRWIAAVVLCLPFTIAHFNNPDVTLVGALNVFLIGILLAVLYFETRRLWMPIALHMSWNLSQSWLWGFDVSGIKIENQLFVIDPKGAEVLTGGGFGLEGSVLTSLLVVVLVLWLLLRHPVRPTAQTSALWARYPAGFGLAPEIEALAEIEKSALASESAAESARPDTSIPADDEPSPA